MVHPVAPLSDVPLLNDQNYLPSGQTALFDAVDEGVRVADSVMKKDERVLVLIITDGDENASKKTTSSDIKDLFRLYELRGNFTFAFIGPDPEKWTRTSGSTNSSNYNSKSPARNFQVFTDGVQNFRSSGRRCQTDGFFD